jgi:hypothetical protein
VTGDEARTVFAEAARYGSDGWLDVAARLEAERPLTMREREAVDVLLAEFKAAVESLGRTLAGRNEDAPK